MTARNAALSVVLAVFSGCACDTVPDDALERCEANQVFAGNVATDILFVIDDSQSMSGEQEKLRDALSRFIETLAASPVADDYQIGVTTTSVQTYGGLRFYTSGPAVDLPFPRGIAVAVSPSVDPTDPTTWGDFVYGSSGFEGSRILTSASPATLVQDFERNVLVGTSGAGREQPLEAARLALTDEVATGAKNEFLVRPGARLAVVFLTDEDDCSGPPDVGTITSDETCQAARTAAGSTLVPVSEYVDFFRGPIAGEVREVVVAAIAGVTCTGGICTNTLTGCPGAIATPDRVLEVLSGMDAARTRLASICDADFDQALTDFATAIMSQTLPLDGAPADWRMLVASVERPGTGTIPCTVQPADAPAGDRNAAGAVYSPPQQGRPASLTFQGACTLEPGDRIDVKVVCAG